MERRTLKKKIYLSGIDGRAAQLARENGLGYEIADFCYAPVLEDRYKIDVQPEDSGYDLLEKAGRKRSFLMRGAQVDTQRMARVLLDEFRGGKLGRFTLETVEDAQ